MIRLTTPVDRPPSRLCPSWTSVVEQTQANSSRCKPQPSGPCSQGQPCSLQMCDSGEAKAVRMRLTNPSRVSSSTSLLSASAAAGSVGLSEGQPDATTCVLAATIRHSWLCFRCGSFLLRVSHKTNQPTWRQLGTGVLKRTQSCQSRPPTANAQADEQRSIFPGGPTRRRASPKPGRPRRTSHLCA